MPLMAAILLQMQRAYEGVLAGDSSATHSEEHCAYSAIWLRPNVPRLAHGSADFRIEACRVERVNDV
jgi:hypothetical protein